MKVAIVGAGIGGLSTTLALRRIGIEPAVFEQAADLRAIQIGYGIHLWSNAMRALGKLGVADQVEAAGERFERMQIMNLRGKLLFDFPVGELAQEVGAPTIGINRADLHGVLAGAVGEGSIRYGSQLVDFEQGEDGVTLTFEDGHEAHADLLVGADGSKSFVRSKVLGDGPPHYVGVVERHAAVAVSDERVPPRTFRERWAGGARFGFYPIKGGTCWYTLVPEAADGRDPHGAKQAVLDRFGSWPEPTPALVAATPEEDVVRFDIRARRPVDRWSDGRVVLLGDAAHAMPPTGGQGSASAIEDALVLADCLGTQPDLAGALAAFEARRMPRVHKFMQNGWKQGNLAAVRNPLVATMRNTAMPLLTARVWRDQKRTLSAEP
jgi:2-polyprenyl-6-methoxyphenol hydroxylase-like FAD-dependent oxidoreductase